MPSAAGRQDGNQRDNGGPHQTRPHTATVLTSGYWTCGPAGTLQR